MEIDEEDYLSHYGVKGMRWGKRGTRRVQKTLDRYDRIAKGTATKGDRWLAGVLVTKKGAAKTLKRGAENQKKILAGKKQLTNGVAFLNGIKIKDLNYHQT